MITIPSIVQVYAGVLIRLGVRPLARVGCLTIASAITEGVGLLLLVPLLAVAGLVPDGSGSAAGPLAAVPFLPSPPHLAVVLAAFVMVAIGRALLVRSRDVQAVRLQLRAVDDLRVRLYRAIASAGWPHLAAQRRSDLLQTLTADVLRVGLGVQVTFDAAMCAVLTIAYLAVAVSLSPLGTAVAGTVAALMLITSIPRMRQARRLGDRLTHRNRRLYATATDFLDGIKSAKAANAECAYLATFRGVVADEQSAVLDYRRATANSAAAYAIASAAALAAVVAGAVGWFAIEPARLLVLVLVFARLLPLAGTLVQRCQQVAHTMPAFAAVQAMLDSCDAAAEHVSAPGERVAPPEKAIALRSVTVRLGADRPAALVDVDVVVPARATTAIIGPSGAGKSTFADVLCGLLPATSGTVEVDGVVIDAALRRTWRDQIAYVPQDTVLAAGSIADNLRRNDPGASDEQLWDALRSAAAEPFVRAMPAGLATEVGDRAVRLSGGERQRLALAGALLRRPSVLVLDESTSALDTDHEREIRRSLDALGGQLTIVVIAHRMSAVREADWVIMLDQGRVVGAGTWAELDRDTAGPLRAPALPMGAEAAW